MSLAPPATRDGWSYSGEFHVQASGHNHHRRATIPELRAVFDGSAGPKDRPAHWYEAQLIHYGLPPSKVKGTAKMRLLDAVNKGNLAVPSHILKTEAELKKEWTKREREAKQALKKTSATTTATPAKRPNKRKADDGQAGVISGTTVNLNLSLSIGPQGNVEVRPPGPASKRAKTTSTAKKSKPAKPTPRPPPQTAPRTKQTARRSRPFNRAGQGRSAASIPQPSRVDATPPQWDSPDDPPPPYPGSPRHQVDSYSEDGYDNHTKDSYDSYSGGGYHNEDDHHGGVLPPLGLLNGRYRLRCTAPHHLADRGEDSALILTLDGEALWGSFEIGPLSGILRLDERPWASSEQPLYLSGAETTTRETVMKKPMTGATSSSWVTGR